MNDAGVTTAVDGGGERPLTEQPAQRSPRIRRRVALFVAVTLILTACFLVYRHYRIKSLAEGCSKSFHSGDWASLERDAERWRWWVGEEPLSTIYLAEAAFRTQRLERAVELIDQLPDNDPRTPAALLERSSVLLGPLNRPIEAAETLERAVRLDPKLTEARRRLIFFYAFTLQRKKMTEHAYEAIRHGSDLPETYVYLMLRDSLSFGNAYDQNSKWLAGNPDESMFLVARMIYRIRTQALDSLDSTMMSEQRDADGKFPHQKTMAEFLQRFPKNTEVLAYHIDRAIANGDTETVANLLHQAPPEAADDNRFWRYHGWLQATRGEAAEARESYLKALKINCYDHLARHQLAGVERQLKRLDDVKTLENLANEGRELRRAILGLPSVDKVPLNISRRMLEYAKRCGDSAVAEKLAQHLGQTPSAEAKP